MGYLSPPQLWRVDKNTLYSYRIVAKTRPAPPFHAGSQGPFYVQLCKSTDHCFDHKVELTGLVAGEAKEFKASRVFISPTSFDFWFIKISSGTRDAWFCESIEVFFGGDLTAGAIDMFSRSNLYSINSWIADVEHPRGMTDGSYYYYGPEWQNLVEPRFSFPLQTRETKSTLFLSVDICGGCDIGYECVQSDLKPVERLVRQFSPELMTKQGAPLPVAYAEAYCIPICGDGRVVH